MELTQISRSDGQDQSKLKEINEKSNLWKLLIGGFTLRTRLDLNEKYLVPIRKIFEDMESIGSSKSSGSEGKAKMFAKLLKLMGISFKGIDLKLALSNEETFEMFKPMIPGNLVNLDCVDLIDLIGSLVIEKSFIKHYDDTPFIREFIDALHDHAKANIEVGLTCDSFTLSGSFQTEGLKELFDHIMAGMVDE